MVKVKLEEVGVEIDADTLDSAELWPFVEAWMRWAEHSYIAMDVIPIEDIIAMLEYRQCPSEILAALTEWAGQKEETLKMMHGGRTDAN